VTLTMKTMLVGLKLAAVCGLVLPVRETLSYYCMRLKLPVHKVIKLAEMARRPTQGLC
jgi:hypothetical protein